MFEDENEAAVENLFLLFDMSLKSALCIAVHKGNEILVQQLLQRGADPNVTHDDEPLFHQVINILESCVEDFLKHGVDVNAMNGYGESSLHLAAQAEDKKLLQRLLKYGGNPWVLNNQGQSTLTYAATFVEWSTSSLEFLLKNCLFDINQQDFNGNTILHNVFREHEMGTLRCEAFYHCLLNGANYEIQNYEQKYPEYFCTCALTGQNILDCRAQNFFNKMLILNESYVNKFKAINLEFEMMDCQIKTQMQLELTSTKNIVIKGRFLNGCFEKKSMFDFIFLRRNATTYFIRDIQMNHSVQITGPQLLPLIEVKYRSAVNRFGATQQSLNKLRLITEDRYTPDLVLKKILSFFSNVELFEIVNTQWKKFI